MTYCEYTVHTLSGKKIADVKLEDQETITEQLKRVVSGQERISYRP